ncbi:hypothetical protein N7455_007409 [Penicillium solitum]|uniref:uncharacterized protein n=1 Tax=Penicillium solitum TaxID=60172 RepID=UPI0032C49477|nr:hypothetical protein N7455_007409 [Penicillium solitum]
MLVGMRRAVWLEAVTGPALNPPLNLAEGRVLGFLAELIAEANYEQNTEQILDKKCLMIAALCMGDVGSDRAVAECICGFTGWAS